jgi:hypothetical protein
VDPLDVLAPGDGAATPPVFVAASALVGAASAASDRSVATAFDPPTGPSSGGGGLQYGYRHLRESPKVLQKQRQRVVVKLDVNVAASGFTVVSVTVLSTRTR